MILYNFNSENSKILDINDKSTKLIKIFKNGLIYVRKNKKLFFFEIESGKEILLYEHSYTIVSLAVDHNFIASIDKRHQINIFNFNSRSFICNDINFKYLKDIPKSLLKMRFFEMEYPYYSCIKGDFFCFTTDYGIVGLNMQSQFGYKE